MATFDLFFSYGHKAPALTLSGTLITAFSGCQNMDLSCTGYIAFFVEKAPWRASLVPLHTHSKPSLSWSLRHKKLTSLEAIIRYKRVWFGLYAHCSRDLGSNKLRFGQTFFRYNRGLVYSLFILSLLWATICLTLTCGATIHTWLQKQAFFAP